MRSEPEFFLGEEKVAFTRSYTYLGLTFTGPRFSLEEVACARLSHGYAALGSVKNNVHAHIQFQELRTKLRLFNTLVTSSLLYGVEICELSLHMVHNWTDLKRSLVSRIASLIRNKVLVPHDILFAEMGAALTVTDALFWSVTGAWWICEFPKKTKTGTYVIKDNHCQYAEIQ